MRWIDAENPAEAVDVPAELLAGPDIRRWSDPVLVSKIDREHRHPDRDDLMFDAALRARSRWSAAVAEWADAVGLTVHDARCVVPARRPYWG